MRVPLHVKLCTKRLLSSTDVSFISEDVAPMDLSRDKEHIVYLIQNQDAHL